LLLGVLKEPKHLEKFVLILFGNTHASVLDSNNKLIIDDGYLDMDLPALRELDGIALESQQHLLHPLLVCVHHVRMRLIFKLMVDVVMLSILHYVVEGGMQSKFVVLRFALLDEHYLFHSRNDVEFHNVFPKFARLYLGIV
jgi:hypothetical protein